MVANIYSYVSFRFDRSIGYGYICKGLCLITKK